MGIIKMPGVKAYRSKGRVYHYHRASGIRLRGEPGSVEFAKHLEELETPPAGMQDTPGAPGTIKAGIALFKGSAEYKRLKPSTRGEYDSVLLILDRLWGGLQVRRLRRANVLNERDRLGRGVGFRNSFVRVTKRFLSFAVDRDLRPDNPLLRMKLEPIGSWEPWPPAAVDRFLADAPPKIKLAAIVGLYTGQRLSDCLRMTWTAYNGETIEVKQGKTGNPVSVYCLPELRRALDAEPRVAVQILTSPKGKPWTKSHFQHEFHQAVVKAGLNGLNFHGLRHTMGTDIAEGGGSEREIQAALGQESAAMAQRYSKRASQKRLAKSAVLHMERNRKRTRRV